jgi:hypothetical protein
MVFLRWLATKVSQSDYRRSWIVTRIIKVPIIIGMRKNNKLVARWPVYQAIYAVSLNYHALVATASDAVVTLTMLEL